MPLDSLRYPIGFFEPPADLSMPQVSAWIDEIAALPAVLRATVEPLDTAQLDTPYRVEGWTVRQVVHHLADSHTNSLIRFKWALTEERPTIKPYVEQRWAELPDNATIPLGENLDFLAAVHGRLVRLLRCLGPDDLQREFDHPESGIVRLDQNVGIYAWHGRHHLGHITELIKREGWMI